MRSILGLSVVVVAALAASEARAQYFPGSSGSGAYGGYGGYGSGSWGPPGAFGGAPGSGYPGLYGGGLSPYLNLRSRNLGNAATNYYNFVRPYTGGTFGNAFVSPNVYGPAVRQPLFPNLRPIYDEDLSSQTLEKDKEGVMRTEMPPAGHGAGFMNQMGYFGPQGAGAGRPASTPAAARRPR
jgi:hypothetical protein